MWEFPDNQEVGLEAATLQRKRNSSLVKSSRAENPTGLKHGAEAVGPDLRVGSVGERSVSLRSRRASGGGGIASANAAMSSDKPGEKPGRRKPEVSCARVIRAGSVGP